MRIFSLCSITLNKSFVNSQAQGCGIHWKDEEVSDVDVQIYFLVSD